MADSTNVDGMKPVVIVILTFVFVGLYIAAIFGWLGVSPNEKAIALLQPVVYVIIGYYFGRMPSEANEKRLQKDADAKGAQAADATAKVKAARAVLASSSAAPRGAVTPADSRVEAALRILEADGA